MNTIDYPHARHISGEVWRVQSAADKPEYEVFMEAQYCSCPDWKQRKSQYEVGDGRRFCKHMRAVPGYTVPPFGGRAAAAMAPPAVEERLANSARDSQKLIVQNEILSIKLEHARRVAAGEVSGELTDDALIEALDRRLMSRMGASS